MRCITTLATVTAMLVLVVRAPAKSLDPALLPEEAKWVIHIDFDQLEKTSIAQHVAEQKPKWLAEVNQWLQDSYGLDPSTGLHSLTMFSDTYQSHTGCIILNAQFDRSKVIDKLKQQSDITSSQWQDVTIYSCPLSGSKEGKRFSMVLLENTRLVMANSEERVKKAVELVNGKGSSLKGKDSKLIADVPDNSVIYGAAVELRKIARHDGTFPVLQQHEQIVYETGEKDGKVFENLTLVAASPEVAKHMKDVLNGFVSLMKVWASDNDSLSKIVQDVDISIEGATVRSRFQASAKDVVSAMEHLHKRMKSSSDDKSSKVQKSTANEK